MEPRPAATVMLVRESGNSFDVYMLRRSARSAAFPEIYVFPGGTVDAEDAALATRSLLRAGTPYPEGRRPSEPTYEVAALREAFEEAGILLAARRDGSPLEAGLDIEGARAALLAGKRSFGEILDELGAVLDARHVWYFSHWITPTRRELRFDTHFYLAEAPEGQHGSTDEFETHDGIWIAPADALSRYASGDLPLIFPTIKHLERIAAYPTLAALRAFATTKAIRTVQNHEGRVLPQGFEGAW